MLQFRTGSTNDPNFEAVINRELLRKFSFEHLPADFSKDQNIEMFPIKVIVGSITSGSIYNYKEIPTIKKDCHDWLLTVDESSVALSFDDPLQIERTISILRTKGISVPEPQIIIDFLSSCPDMINLLLKVSLDARVIFNEDTQISVELYVDPEINDEILTLYVRQNIYEGDILDNIENFRSKYEFEISQRSEWLHITTDFRKPRR